MADNENHNSGPSVTTDKMDYAPGSTAVINTTGFEAGSTVQLSVQIIDAGADGAIGTADDTLGPAVTWLATDGSASDADGVANGEVATNFYVDQIYGDKTMLLSATQGQVGADGAFVATGPTATEVFTDAVGIPVPHIAVTKTEHLVDTDMDGKADAGETINYDITVTNDGTAPLTNVHVNDPVTGNPIDGASSLDPGQSTVFHSHYTLTQADIDAGGVGAGHVGNSVLNTATGSGKAPDGVEVSATATAATPIDARHSLDVTKVGVLNDTDLDGKADAGETIDYTITVKNTGTQTIHGITVTDPVTGNPVDGATDLAPGASTDYHAHYTLTQADIDNGGTGSGHALNSVLNTATATDNVGDTDTDTAATPIDARHSLDVTKVGVLNDTDLDGQADAGETIDYTITVKNTGTQTIHGIVVTDPVTGNPVDGATDLAPGQSTDYHSHYTLTQADIDNGGTGSGHALNSVLNTATATDNVGDTDTDTAATPIDARHSLDVTKVGVLNDTDLDGQADAGETIDYTITVKNTGTQTIHGITVTDPVTGNPVDGLPDLAPGQSTDYHSHYTLTQADIDNGGTGSGHALNSVLNTATATDNVGDTDTDTAATPIDARHSLDVTKVGVLNDTDLDGQADAGETIDYTITVKNTGTQTIHGIVVTDPVTGNPVDGATDLAPGASTDYHSHYTLTQADIDNGGTGSGHALNSVLNTAAATDNVGDTDTDTAATPIDARHSLDVTKVGVLNDTDHDGLADAGETINYTITVKNTGTQTIHGITVTDPVTGNPVDGLPDLAPGQSTDYHSHYTLTQADIDNGGTGSGHALNSVLNTATATDNVGDTDTDTAATPIDARHSLDVTKVGVLNDTDLDGKADAGETINYTITVKNTGTQTIHGITVTDPVTGNPVDGLPDLAPGQSTDYHSHYTLTQADIDNGGTGSGHALNSVLNTATATDNVGDTDTDTAATPIDARHSLDVTKVGVLNDTDHDGKADAGETINYTITVKNTGTQTIHGIVVTDPVTGNPVDGATDLAPGQSTDYHSHYTLTQADIDNGGTGAGHLNDTVLNTATATDSFGDTDTDTWSTPIDDRHSLTINKVGVLNDTDHDGKADVGETINYDITVTNTGTRTLTGIDLTDVLTGEPTGGSTTLNAGQSAVFHASHTVTQADIDNHGAGAGHANNSVLNTVTVTDDQGDTGSSTWANPIDYTPGLAIVKTVSSVTDTNHNGKNDAGDVINYAITVTNNGDVTLNHVVVTDSLTHATVTPTGGITLAVGTSQTYTTQHYTITAADITNQGSVDGTADKALTNTATADSDETGPASSSVTTAIASNSGIAIDKTVTCVVDNDCDGLTDAGDVITYNIKVTNTGSVVLTGVTVVDPLTGGTVASNVSIAVGKSVNYTKTYTIKQSDMDNNGNPAGSGDIVNTASVTDAQGDSASDSVSTDLDVVSKLSVLKTVASITDTNHNGKTDAGDVINYSIKVTNGGNAALHHVVVTDSLTNATVTPTGGITLNAGASTTYTTQHYTITAADMANKGAIDGTADKALTNTATADSDETAPVSSSVTTALAFSGISIAKSVTCVTDNDCDGLTDAGDVITYNIKVTNTGNLALTGISVLDPMTGGTVASGVSLAIGASVNYTRSYTIKQADMDNIGNPAGSGDIVNTATVTDAQGDSASASVKTDLDVKSGIDIQKLVSVDGGVNWYFTKSGSGDSFTVAQMSTMTGIASAKLHIGTPTIAAGSAVQFKVVVTNTGNVTDHNVAVTDAAADTPELNGASFKFAGATTIGSLAPGASKLSDALVAVAQTGTHTDVATAQGAFGTANTALSSTNDMVAYTGTFTSTTASHNTDWWASHHVVGCNDSQWHEATYNGQSGILLGDYSGTAWYGSGTAASPKALTSIASGMLFISDAAATDILAGAKSTTDTRLVLAAQAITAQLNIDNGVDDAGYMPGTNPAGHDLIGEAVKWLSGQGPFTYADGSSGKIDTNGDRVLSAGNSNSYEFNTSTGQFTSAAQSTSKKEWNGAVDVINTTPKAGDIMITGEDLKNALASFNSNGLQLVTSLAGTQVGWDNASLGAIDVVQNTPDAFWGVLAEHGVIAGTTYVAAAQTSPRNG